MTSLGFADGHFSDGTFQSIAFMSQVDPFFGKVWVNLVPEEDLY